MTKKQVWIGAACLYGIGLVVVHSIAASQPTNPTGWAGLFVVPLVWGTGPIGLAFVWLALKRWDLTAAKFGLSIFAGLYPLIVFIRWWWQDLLQPGVHADCPSVSEIVLVKCRGNRLSAGLGTAIDSTDGVGAACGARDHSSRYTLAM